MLACPSCLLNYLMLVPFEMNCDEVLTCDVPESRLHAGDVGTLVGRHVVSGVADEGYSVEFFEIPGNTVAVVRLPASALCLPTPADRSTVRCHTA